MNTIEHNVQSISIENNSFIDTFAIVNKEFCNFSTRKYGEAEFASLYLLIGRRSPLLWDIVS